MGGHNGHHRRKTLGPAGPQGRIGQGGGQLANHRLGHQALAALVPLQAGGERCEQPPADPLHRHRQAQGLGDRQAPGASGMGGIHDHRHTGRHRCLDALVQQGLDFPPGTLHGGVAKQLAAHHIRRKSHGTAEFGQHPGQSGLTAGGRADQQVAAQGRWRRSGRRAGHGHSVAGWGVPLQGSTSERAKESPCFQRDPPGSVAISQQERQNNRPRC